jgi:hypothetical protein
MLTELNEEQLQLADQTLNKWLDLALKSDGKVRPDDAVKFADYIYKLTELDAPLCVVVRSPREAQLAANAIMRLRERNELEPVNAGTPASQRLIDLQRAAG